MKWTPELFMGLAQLIGALVLFVIDKTEPAYFLLGTGGYGMVRGAARPPSNRTKD